MQTVSNGRNYQIWLQRSIDQIEAGQTRDTGQSPKFVNSQGTFEALDSVHRFLNKKTHVRSCQNTEDE